MDREAIFISFFFFSEYDNTFNTNLICDIGIDVFTKCVAFRETRGRVLDQIECFERSEWRQQFLDLQHENWVSVRPSFWLNLLESCMSYVLIYVGSVFAVLTTRALFVSFNFWIKRCQSTEVQIWEQDTYEMQDSNTTWKHSKRETSYILSSCSQSHRHGHSPLKQTHGFPQPVFLSFRHTLSPFTHTVINWFSRNKYKHVYYLCCPHTCDKRTWYQ